MGGYYNGQMENCLAPRFFSCFCSRYTTSQQDSSQRRQGENELCSEERSLGGDSDDPETPGTGCPE